MNSWYEWKSFNSYSSVWKRCRKEKCFLIRLSSYFCSLNDDIYRMGAKWTVLIEPMSFFVTTAIGVSRDEHLALKWDRRRLNIDRYIFQELNKQYEEMEKRKKKHDWSIIKFKIIDANLISTKICQHINRSEWRLHSNFLHYLNYIWREFHRATCYVELESHQIHVDFQQVPPVVNDLHDR